MRGRVDSAFGSPDLSTLNASAPGARSLGLLIILSTALLCLAAATRSPDDTEDVRPSARMTPAIYARFPLIAAQMAAFDTGFSLLGWQGANYAWLAGGAILGGSFIFWNHLPRVPSLARRLAAFPATWTGTLLFTSVIGAQLTDMFQRQDAGAMLHSAQAQGMEGYFWFVMTLLAGGALAFYVMFIMAPRAIAAGRTSWWAWGLRFAVYFVGVALNLSVPGW
ncbi:MAG: hypothetical protein AB7I33_06780 [Gemmatimonadales bacterium]